MFSEMVVSSNQLLTDVTGCRLAFDALGLAMSDNETHSDLVAPRVLDVWFGALGALPNQRFRHCIFHRMPLVFF